MSEPRFLIVHGCTEQGVSSPEWPTRENPFAVRNQPDGDWLSWRLLSGNNRELGRSAEVHPSESECLAAITLVQSRAEGLDSSIGVRSSGQWWWQLDLGGATVAVSGRVYQRQRECRYNFEQFLGALPMALRPAPAARGRLDLREPRDLRQGREDRGVHADRGAREDREIRQLREVRVRDARVVAEERTARDAEMTVLRRPEPPVCRIVTPTERLRRTRMAP